MSAKNKLNLVYIWSLRNAAADKAGQYVPYKGGLRYMKSPLEYLAEALDTTELGDLYSLKAVIFDDDEGSARDRENLKDYGFEAEHGRQWYFPIDQKVQGKPLNSLLVSIPSVYRRLPLQSPERPAGKSAFESQVLRVLTELKADVVLVDGLILILDELVREASPFHRKIINIHPGITRLDSPYERRGAYATLDALYGARGEKVVNWKTMEKVPVAPIQKTGASFHYCDNGIDSGEVIVDVLNTHIDPEDTILELRWNNFNASLFPAMYQGLLTLALLNAPAMDRSARQVATTNP